MDGRRKERKLIVKENQKIVFTDVLEAIRCILKVDLDSISTAMNFYYSDTYYDDNEFTLLNQGGSLKIREGVFPDTCYSHSSKLVMRMKTTNPQKLKYTEWDEVEETFQKINVKKFADTFLAIKGFFPKFDFDKIVEEPVLKCNTSRTQYKIEDLTIMFDHVEYEAHGKIASDDLLKIRGKCISKVEADKLFEALLKMFPQYELIEASRYERALQRLSKN